MSFVWLATYWLLQTSDPAAIEDQLRRAKNEYSYGNYPAAIEKLNDLLYPMRLSSDAQVIEARKYLALSYFLLERFEDMREEFAKLLHLDPDYQLDPFTVAPNVIELFETVRNTLVQELDAIRQLKSNTKKTSAPIILKESPPGRTIIKQSELVTLMPFGIGQFQNGDIKLGVLMAVAQAGLLLTNLAAYIYAVEIVGPSYPDDKRKLVQALAVTQYSSLGLFGLAWSLGVVHARLHFVPFIENTANSNHVSKANKPGPRPSLTLQGNF